jgi:hypothetical protein
VTGDLPGTPDRALRVFVKGGAQCWVDPSDETQIAAAKRRQLEARAAGTLEYDELLTVTTAGGSTWTVPISQIVDWIDSTRETRERDNTIVTAADREYAEDKRAAWPDGPSDD